MQVKIWFQNRRARERRDKESDQRKEPEISPASDNTGRPGLPSTDVSYFTGENTSDPRRSLNLTPQDNYPLLNVVPEKLKTSLEMFKAPSQMTIPNYILKGMHCSIFKGANHRSAPFFPEIY